MIIDFTDTMVWLKSFASEETIKRLFIEATKSTDIELHYALVDYRHTPAEILTELAKKEGWVLRLYVTRHDNLPLEELENLCNDSHKYVRETAKEELARRRKQEEK